MYRNIYTVFICSHKHTYTCTYKAEVMTYLIFLALDSELKAVSGLCGSIEVTVVYELLTGDFLKYKEQKPIIIFVTEALLDSEAIIREFES